MRHRRASRLVLLVMPFLLIVAARTAAVRAQQGPVITSRAYTIFGEKKYPASPTTPCSLDTARLTGVIQVDTRVTSEAGTYKAEIYSNLIDVTGTGDVSGLPYRAHGPSQMDYSWAGPGGASVPFMGTYELFSPGSCPATRLDALGALKINPNGAQDPDSAFSAFSFNPD